MTKHWYHTMQKTYCHILLKIDPRADQFSEEYFEQLNQIEKKNMKNT